MLELVPCDFLCASFVRRKSPYLRCKQGQGMQKLRNDQLRSLTTPAALADAISVTTALPCLNFAAACFCASMI